MVAKLILLSVLVAHIVIPALAARDPDPARGLKRALVRIALFNLAYAAAVLSVVPRLMG